MRIFPGARFENDQSQYLRREFFRRGERTPDPQAVARYSRGISAAIESGDHRRGNRRTTMPKTRSEYWEIKFRRNVERDQEAECRLTAAGWSVLIVWECETYDLKGLADKLRDFLAGPNLPKEQMRPPRLSPQAPEPM
jgi:hypothetical protein